MPAPFWAFVGLIAIVALLPILVFVLVLQAMLIAAIAQLFDRLRHAVNRLAP